LTGRDGGILLVTDRRFWRRSIGSEQRIASLVDHLAARPQPLAIAYLGRLDAGDRRTLARPGSLAPAVRVRTRSEGRLAGALTRFTARLATLLGASGSTHRASRARDGRNDGGRAATGRANPLLANRSPDRRAFVQALIAELAPRAVIVQFTRNTYLIADRAPAVNRETAYLIDTHDVLHERAERFRAAGAEIPVEVDANDEAAALACYDAILAIQARDAHTLRALVPDRPVLVVPHGIPLPDAPPARRPGPIRLGFLGGRDESNHAALVWFLDHIWEPLASEHGDDVVLAIGGQICRRWTRRAPGLRVVGPVDAIGDFWREVDIALNPVRFGSGLKIKNVEALAYGRPLVTSPIGAEGLEPASPAGLAIADTPEEWLRVLRAWIADPTRADEVGRQGRLFAERHFAPAAAFAELDRQLDALARATSGSARP